MVQPGQIVGGGTKQIAGVQPVGGFLPNASLLNPGGAGQADLAYDNNMKGWGPELCERRPDITMAQVDAFLTNLYRGDRADFVYTVSRDFVRQCQTPV
jgi:hypothetical protein